MTLAVVFSGVVAVIVAVVAPKLTEQSLQTIRDDVDERSSSAHQT
ncbi:hypothetical protein [Halopelagius fulvigenes]|uniref:Uncharacterized protein n=1 Tax=Halopelagius fulvigenes TaxID=1198324 RepID=A0ABD5TXW7_9EURY